MERIPYSPTELISDTFYPAMISGQTGVKKFHTPVTPRENICALYSGEKPLWIPAGSDRKMITPRIDPDNVARCFVSDAQALAPEEMTGGKDKHGVEWVYVPVARGSMVKPGSPVLEDANDWEKVVQFPDLDAWDWAGSIAANKPMLDKDERAISITILTGFFERLISLMDFDKAAVALIDEEQKDAVKALFDRLADLYIDMLNRYKKAYNPTIFCLHDDWGSQRSPFFSLATILEMIVPSLRRVVDAAHEAGMFFDMHSCGKNELIVPAYIEAGADSWGGQSMNNKAMLYEKYGDKLILSLEPDISFTPETTDEEARAAAKRFVEKYAPTMETKPFLCSSMGATPAFADALYEESRKFLS
ncbi:MAG: methyltransferase [Clostridiales bacterium]|nr:methyltransferase [Clostridiales bacterium]